MHSSRKSTRLPSADYLGPQSYFVTICCDLHRCYLSDANLANRIMILLRETAVRRNFQLHAYCLMPDHLHLLAEGITPHSDLREFMRIFKLRTAFEFRQSRSLPLWEHSYYDHTLRRSDSPESVAIYIWNNPVRKNLCTHPNDYPFSGSQTISWMQHARNIPSWSPPWRKPL
jgi:REP element-mobilizing transposase RayT